MRHFTIEEDTKILQEISAKPPFHVIHGQSKEAWEELAAKISESIGRTLTYRAVQDRFAILMKKFKKKEAVSRKESGVSEEVSAMDTLLQECLNAMEGPKPTKKTFKVSRRKDLALRRFSGNPESSELSDLEDPVATDTRPLPTIKPPSITRRPKDPELPNFMMNYAASSRASNDERNNSEKSKARSEKKRTKIERERFDFEIRRYEEDKQKAELEIMRRHEEEKKKTDFERQKYEDEKEKQREDLEIRKRQQALQEQKDNAMIGILASITPLLSQIAGKKKPPPKKRK